MRIKTLIIDDNKRYTAMLCAKLELCGCEVEHASASKIGLEMLRQKSPGYYHLIISDITMESQISGILLAPKIRALGFKGCLIIYSTGFNFHLVLMLSRLLFKILGADGLIAKNGLSADRPELIKLSGHPLLNLIHHAWSIPIKNA
jgi:CheY-like chemotaxis protein